jgi:hypothetical protein
VRRFWIFESVNDNEYGIYLNTLGVRVTAAVRDPWPRDGGICEGSLSLCRRPAPEPGRERGAQIDPGNQQDHVAKNPVKFLNDRSGDLTAGTSLPYCSEQKR